MILRDKTVCSVGFRVLIINCNWVRKQNSFVPPPPSDNVYDRKIGNPRDMIQGRDAKFYSSSNKGKRRNIEFGNPAHTTWLLVATCTKPLGSRRSYHYSGILLSVNFPLPNPFFPPPPRTWQRLWSGGGVPLVVITYSFRTPISIDNDSNGFLLSHPCAFPFSF
jgi:hypothetical protein